VRIGQEALVFDTPTDDQSAQKLIHLVQDSLHCKIVAVIPTHFHNDCLGGLLAFHTAGIPSIAHEKTIELTKENQLIEPQQGFKVSTTLRVGTQQVLVKFFGEGHTRDNVVAYFPSEQVLFGGCLIKELNATKGYLGDANLQAWADTVSKIQVAFPHVKHVVPGHGAAGDPLLLDYTKKLFEK
jgi:metallo-beta-lactamase class B